MFFILFLQAFCVGDNRAKVVCGDGNSHTFEAAATVANCRLVSSL